MQTLYLQLNKSEFKLSAVSKVARNNLRTTVIRRGGHRVIDYRMSFLFHLRLLVPDGNVFTILSLIVTDQAKAMTMITLLDRNQQYSGNEKINQNSYCLGFS